MTATLKNTPQGYVLIVDERPKIGDKYISIYTGNTYTRQMENDKQYSSNHFKIIASETPLEGVKGIRFHIKDSLTNTYATAVGWDRYIKDHIDTEVQATEHEEYWVVGL